MAIVVVGAGIIGAAIADALARAGQDVTVLAAQPGEATTASFGWINGSFFADEAHHRLRVAGIAAYHRLLQSDPSLPIQICGALWWEAQGEGLTSMHTTLKSLGYPVEIMSRADLINMEPALADPPLTALRFPSEGCVQSADLSRALLARAKSRGARMVWGAKVTAVMEANGKVRGVRTSLGDVSADQVVVAAGTGAPEILKTVGLDLPMLTRPGAIVTSKPIKARLNSVLVTPQGEVRQLADGRLLSPEAPNHQGDERDALREAADTIAQKTCALLANLVGLPELGWSDVRLAHRPVPQDGLPVLGPAGPAGLHVAVMHSGVTLAAIAAELTQAHITGQVSTKRAALIAPYDPMRFTQKAPAVNGGLR